MASISSTAVLLLVIFFTDSHQQEKFKPKKICDLECKKKPIDVAFVIDASSSIWPDNFTDGLWFVADFVDVFDIKPDMMRVAAVSFGDRVYKEDAFGFEAYPNKRSLKAAIDRIPYRAGSATETGAAIRHVRERFLPTARPEVKKVCVVLTDGNSQKGRVTAREAKALRDAGMEMFAVGIGQNVSENELRNIAGVDEHVFMVNSYNMLRIIRARLAFEVCNENPDEDIICRDHPIDVSLIIDASSSIGTTNFTIGLNFVKSFVTSFDISTKRARFSVITYGRGTYDNTAIDFDTYSDHVSLENAIGNIPYTAGDYTGTGSGIKFMRERQMLPHQRPEAAHIAIVLTDGQSQDSEETQREAATSRRAGITMFAIGVGIDVSERELNDIAGDPSRVFVVNHYAALETIRRELDKKTCVSVLGAFRTMNP